MIKAGACIHLLIATEGLGLGYGHAVESCSLIEECNAQGSTTLLTAFAHAIIGESGVSCKPP